MNCPRCTAEVEEGAEECPNCGAKLDAESPDAYQTPAGDADAELAGREAGGGVVRRGRGWMRRYV
jgi:uncharacterized membrane protein YvbJ